MVKIVVLIKRKEGMSLQDFRDYYFDHHAALSKRVLPRELAAKITHYAQNHARPIGDGTKDQPYDCVAEICFSDLDGVRMWNEWYLGPEGAVLRDDEDQFMDKSKRVVVLTDELEPVQPNG